MKAILPKAHRHSSSLPTNSARRFASSAGSAASNPPYFSNTQDGLIPVRRLPPQHSRSRLVGGFETIRMHERSHCMSDM